MVPSLAEFEESLDNALRYRVWISGDPIGGRSWTYGVPSNMEYSVILWFHVYFILFSTDERCSTHHWSPKWGTWSVWGLWELAGVFWDQGCLLMVGQCTLNSACWHPGKQVFCSTWSGSERVFCLKEWVVFWNEWHTMCEEQKKETFTKMRRFKTSRFWNKAHNIHFASCNKMKASLGHIYYSPASHRVLMALSLSSSAFQIQCALRCAWGQCWGCNWAPEDHSPGC